MIDPHTIQQIKETARIEEVIQDFVSLKRAGVNYKGNCPFHNEKTPSFVVSPAKGIYHCFGCGASGDSAKFIMEHEKISYPEAIKYLGKKYNINVPEQAVSEEVSQELKERESLYIVNEFAKKFFITSLYHTDEGKSIGLSYFRERGFREDIIKKFELGWSPQQRDAITQAAKKQGYKALYLQKLGLSILKEDGYEFDRFAGRVMFPILSLSGKTVAFGGRILRTDKNTAKYLNSPESDLYHKSDILYGIFQAKKDIVKLDKCYMVEGYTDVISMHQTGIENVVASSGTALTENQVKLVKRFTNNLTILYDGDAAGIKASLRGIDIVLAQEMNVRVVLLPDGEDPDSFSRKSTAEEFHNYIKKHEQNFIRFKTELLMHEAENDPIKRAQLVTNVMQSVSIIPDRILRAEYIKECSTLLKIKEEILYDEVRKKVLQNTGHDQSKRYETTNTNIKTTAHIPAFVQGIYSEANEREVLYFLLNFGKMKLDSENTSETATKAAEYIISEIQNEELDFQNLIYKQIFEDFEKFLVINEVPDTNYFLHHQNPEIRSITAEIISPGYELSKLWKKRGGGEKPIEERLHESIPEAIVRFKFKILELMIADIDADISATNADNSERFIELFTQKVKLDEVKVLLKTDAGERIIL